MRSRLGCSASVSAGELKRRTVTARTVLVVWLAPSTATAISVLRPTSPPRGTYEQSNGAAVTSHSRRSSS